MVDDRLPDAIVVFPTRVGVNRVALATPATLAVVFPTRVGVNRAPGGGKVDTDKYSPRVWG